VLLYEIKRYISNLDYTTFSRMIIQLGINHSL
jgi:hypothetical protein